MRIIVYSTRALSHYDEFEEGSAQGVWGNYDTWGKREFTPVNGPSLYLFDDEVVSDEELPTHPRCSLVLSSVPCYVCGERTNHLADCRWNTDAEPEEVPAQAVVTWQARFEAAADRLLDLAKLASTDRRLYYQVYPTAVRWSYECRGASVLCEILGV